MNEKIWAVRRQTFCWLDATSVIVVSYDGKNYNKGHCLIMNTVRLKIT